MEDISKDREKDNMIQSNIPRSVRKRMDKKLVDAQFQAIYNKLLWVILGENGGTINAPAADLKEVPKNAALDCKYNKETKSFVITAMLKESKKELLLPGNKIITGDNNDIQRN